MSAFETAELIGKAPIRETFYDEFLRRDSMSMGLYHLAAGATDPQSPHTEDEVYVVLEGDGSIRVGDEDRVVGKGSIVFVEKGIEHRFHSIESAMKVLVFFAPAES